MAPRRAQPSGPAEELVRDRIDRGWKPRQIREELERLRKHGDLRGLRIPSLRTIERRLADRSRMRDASWDPLAGWPRPSPALMSVVAAVIVRTEGRIPGLTRGEARAADRILAAAAPGLEPWIVYRLARRTLDGEGDDVATFLAFEPWRTGEAALRYRSAFDEGWIPTYLSHTADDQKGSLHHLWSTSLSDEIRAEVEAHMHNQEEES